MEYSLLAPILLRFLFGGTAVVLSTLIAHLFGGRIGGIFAAFPAVMIAAVIISGHFEGSKQAGQVAFGATAGMLGCTFCVAAAAMVMHYQQNWLMAIFISLVVWLISSLVFITLMNRYRGL